MSEPNDTQLKAALAANREKDAEISLLKKSLHQLQRMSKTMKRPDIENVTRFDVVRDYGANPGEPGEPGDYVSSDDYDELIHYVKVLEKTLDNQFSPTLRDELIDEANGELYPEAQP